MRTVQGQQEFEREPYPSRRSPTRKIGGLPPTNCAAQLHPLGVLSSIGVGVPVRRNRHLTVTILQNLNIVGTTTCYYFRRSSPKYIR